jgi:hypothetical protein
MKESRKKGRNKALDEKLSRKEWLGKAGKYSVFTAASMMMILRPGKVSAADSLPADPPVWPPAQ